MKFNVIQKKLIFYISFCFFWLSIGSKPSFIENFSLNFQDLVNTTRILLPLILSIIFFIIYIRFIYLNKIKYKIYHLFIFLFIFQLVGLTQNEELDFNLNNSYLAILGIGLTCFLIINDNLEKNYKYFLYFSILILFLVSIIIINNKIIDLIFIQDKYLYSYVIPGEEFFKKTEMPRTTGISRSFSIIALFLISFLIWKQKKNYLIISTSITIFLLVFFVYGFQSRGSLLCFFITFLVIIFFTKNIKIIKKLFLILIFLVFPLISYEIWLNFKTKNPDTILNLLSVTNNKNTKYNTKHLIDPNSTSNRIFDKNATATGRTVLWNEVYQNYNLKKVFGYGPQADRFLIKSDKGTWLGSNSSNAMVYTFASGGYFALLFLLIIYFIGSYNIFKLIFNCKIFHNNHSIEVKISCLFLIYFFTRSIFENSFSLFSTDFILTIVALSIIENFLEKQKNNLFV